MFKLKDQLKKRKISARKFIVLRKFLENTYQFNEFQLNESMEDDYKNLIESILKEVEQYLKSDVIIIDNFMTTRIKLLFPGFHYILGLAYFDSANKKMRSQIRKEQKLLEFLCLNQ